MDDWVVIEKSRVGWELCDLPASVSYTDQYLFFFLSSSNSFSISLLSPFFLLLLPHYHSANPSAADSFKSEPATLWDGINIEEMTPTEARIALLCLIRKGIPDSLRKTVWKKLLGISNSAEKYQTEIIQFLGGFNECLSRFPTVYLFFRF